MSLPELPNTRNPRELRKALLRLRMEMHRQEIATSPPSCSNRCAACAAWAARCEMPGVKHAPLWGMGAVVALGFLTGKGVRSGNMTRLLRLGTSLLPLVRLFLQQPPPLNVARALARAASAQEAMPWLNDRRSRLGLAHPADPRTPGQSPVQPEELGRSPFHKDHDRIIFSGAFRRLGRKTQVHPVTSNDHIHTP
jgi:hypothetical protein